MKTNVSKNRVKLFSRSNNGNVTLVSAMLSLPLLIFTGAAVDYSRLSKAHAFAQHAADSAALAGANQFDMSGDQLSAFVKSVFIENLSGEATFEESDINVSRGTDGIVHFSIDASLKPRFMQLANYEILNFHVSAGATNQEITDSDFGCVYLTDPRNTGLDMTGNSYFGANCSIMINTPNTAIKTRGNAKADFESICTRGSLSTMQGSVTPDETIEDCDVVVDPFADMSPPQELSASCSSNSDISIKSGNGVILAPGVHCGKVTIKNKGKLHLEPGIHYFKDGLDLKNGGTLEGSEVLIAFDKGEDYSLSGNLNVSGLKTGDYKGFVIYNEDFRGNSNRLTIGSNASFRADGVIYLPNTTMDLDAVANEFATQSILVADRFELSGSSSFYARTNLSSSTPLPDTNLYFAGNKPDGTGARLVY